MLKRTVLCSMLLTILGCRIGPSSLPSERLVSGKPEHFIQSNYTKGMPRTALAGEPIVAVKDYWATRIFPNYFILDQQVVIYTDRRSFVLPHGHLLNFLNTVNIDGDNYSIYKDANDAFGEMYYVDHDMRLARFMYVRSRVGSQGVMEKIKAIWPETFRFNGKIELDASSEKPFKVYDIIFDGKDDLGIHATYREHDLGDPSKVVSTRALTFPADSGPFRCGDTEVQVHRCSGQALEYTVTAD